MTLSRKELDIPDRIYHSWLDMCKSHYPPGNLYDVKICGDYSRSQMILSPSPRQYYSIDMSEGSNNLWDAVKERAKNTEEVEYETFDYIFFWNWFWKKRV